MQQKAQLIATLLHEPDLIVIDEPFTALDPVNTRLVKQVLAEQQAAGKTIIMSTHQMYQVEALCDRIVLIDRGQTVLYGLVHEIKRNFAGNALELEGVGDFSLLPGVLETRKKNGAWHMALDVGTDPQLVLRTLANRQDTRIERFELAEPSLDDIFVQVVSRSQEVNDA
jgi:ABC-2 type transport system ATP-binding protein